MEIEGAEHVIAGYIVVRYEMLLTARCGAFGK